MNAVLNYPLGEPPEPGTSKPVAAGLRWLRMPLPLALDHINLWLLEDGDGWTVVDTGFGTAHTKALWERVFQEDMGGRPLKRVLVTHYHPDHAGLAAWLAERFGIEVWMSPGEFDHAHHHYTRSDSSMASGVVGLFRYHGLDQENAAALEERGNAYRQVVDGLPDAYRPMHEGDSITIGARGWQVIIGRGHCPEHVCLYCAEDGLLISGDQVLPRITSNISANPEAPERDPLADFLASLDTLDQLPEDVRVLPSHGKVFEGLHARIAFLREHHLDRLDALVDFCTEARTAFECLPVLFDRELNPHTMMFAMGECIAHLQHLVATGRLVVGDGDADGRARFRVPG
ncbi:MAG: MBL fold metallo-hydrolase [Aquisalimonadaceae bacterium]